MDTQQESQQHWLSRFLRDETFGGMLMLAAAALALLFANSPMSNSYMQLAERTLAIPHVHLSMSVEQWAADFLLAFFFLIAGAELKHELVLGSLSSRKLAIAPLAGALGGMAAAAGMFLVACAAFGGSAEDRRGWAIPTSTDIAFALAVLSIIGRRTAPQIRMLLLSIAVINDLGSILIIGSVFAHDVHVLALVASAAFIGIWWVLQQMHIRSFWVYAPVFALAWYFMHASGVHATVAGMAMGLAANARSAEGGARSGVASLEHWLRPPVAAVAVPLFAFFAAGIDLRNIDVAGRITSALPIAIFIGLVIGQPVGVFAGMWLAVKTRIGQLDSSVRWVDALLAAALAGMGFTVALLVTELAFHGDAVRTADAKLGIIASVLGACALASAAAAYARRPMAATDA